MPTEHWDAKAFGPPEDYNYVEGRTELHGWHVGESVKLIEDNEEGGYEGDVGLIVGTAHTGAGMFGPGGDQLLVLFEDYTEPVGVDADIIEGV
jgi:hypothetical protein